jgi:hypothetical protein
MSDSVALWITLGLTTLGGLVSLIIIAVNLSAKITAMAKDIEALQDDGAEHKAHNQRQHEELFSSRNGMNESITRLNTILEMLVSKQDQMDRKIDALLARREITRQTDRN